jgi:hypothetical protein
MEPKKVALHPISSNPRPNTTKKKRLKEKMGEVSLPQNPFLYRV